MLENEKAENENNASSINEDEYNNIETNKFPQKPVLQAKDGPRKDTNVPEKKAPKYHTTLFLFSLIIIFFAIFFVYPVKSRGTLNVIAGLQIIETSAAYFNKWEERTGEIQPEKLLFLTKEIATAKLQVSRKRLENQQEIVLGLERLNDKVDESEEILWTVNNLQNHLLKHRASLLNLQKTGNEIFTIIDELSILSGSRRISGETDLPELSMWSKFLGSGFKNEQTELNYLIAIIRFRYEKFELMVEEVSNLEKHSQNAFTTSFARQLQNEVPSFNVEAIKELCK
ncbi:hypothetical protein HK096_009371 [Nowakowskiella sp. JEL0078]|nr:hypothetical protein HK096_009371 [Nowakowskiella sp. JEL0078]